MPDGRGLAPTIRGKVGGRSGFGKVGSLGVPEKVGIILQLRFDSALAAT